MTQTKKDEHKGFAICFETDLSNNGYEPYIATKNGINALQGFIFGTIDDIKKFIDKYADKLDVEV